VCPTHTGQCRFAPLFKIVPDNFVNLQLLSPEGSAPDLCFRLDFTFTVYGIVPGWATLRQWNQLYRFKLPLV